MQVITYATHTLSEKKFHPWNLEFLAVKWAVSKKFRDYLIGSSCIYTDNNPLTFVLLTANLLDVPQLDVPQRGGTSMG